MNKLPLSSLMNFVNCHPPHKMREFFEYNTKVITYLVRIKIISFVAKVILWDILNFQWITYIYCTITFSLLNAHYLTKIFYCPLLRFPSSNNQKFFSNIYFQKNQFSCKILFNSIRWNNIMSGVSLSAVRNLLEF